MRLWSTSWSRQRADYSFGEFAHIYSYFNCPKIERLLCSGSISIEVRFFAIQDRGLESRGWKTLCQLGKKGCPCTGMKIAKLEIKTSIAFFLVGLNMTLWTRRANSPRTWSSQDLIIIVISIRSAGVLPSLGQSRSDKNPKNAGFSN